jgi:hypothetical protein
MKKIVLRDLPGDIEKLIDERAKRENLDRRAVVMEILHEAVIESIVEHDVALMSENWIDDEDDEPFGHPPHSVTVTIQCPGAGSG